MPSNETIVACIFGAFGFWLICLLCFIVFIWREYVNNYPQLSVPVGPADWANDESLREEWWRFLLSTAQNQSYVRIRVVNALPYYDKMLTKYSLVLEKKHMTPSCECVCEPNEDMNETVQFVSVEEGHVDAEEGNSHVLDESELKSNEVLSCSLYETDSVIDMEDGQSQIVDESSRAEESDHDQSQFTHIVIPCNIEETAAKLDGEEAIEGGKTRNVPLFCAICHSEYKISDEVTWSSNPECSHVFHHKCISQWVISSLWKQARKRAYMTAVDCPMCRQDFFRVRDEDSLESSVDPEAAGSPVGQRTNE